MAALRRRPRQRINGFARSEPVTQHHRAAYTICRAVYSGAACSCEQRGAGSICETMQRAASAVRAIYGKTE